MINFPDSPALNDTFTVGDVTYTWDGTKWKGSVDTLAGVAVSGDYDDMSGTPRSDWVYISANTTLTLNTSYGVDFTSPRTLTLPLNATVDDVIYIYNTDGDSTGSTIAMQTQTIMDLSENLSIDFNITSIELVYDGTTWRIL